MSSSQHITKKIRKYISNRKSTLESEIRQLLAKGEAGKAFQSKVDGIWFNNVSKKKGNIRKVGHTSKLNMDHIQHTTTILSSPPKKRTLITQQHQPSNPSQQTKLTITLAKIWNIRGPNSRHSPSLIFDSEPILTSGVRAI
jgi:hypothetical protein